ncbi:MAG: TrmH family RNA methyltransferase [Solirubrobacteraceae bacterium]
MTITSPHNEKLKTIRKLNSQRRARDAAGLFVAEGEDLLAAADEAGWTAVDRFCAVGSGLPGIEVEPELLAGASSLGSGTRALAVYEERWAMEAVGPLCVYLHGVGDPGNVGAVLRSAQAFGASCVAFGPGTADPFGPKAVRASMGAIFGVPVAKALAISQLPGTTIALVPAKGAPLAELCRIPSGIRMGFDKVPLTLLIGAEREGLPEELVAQADHQAHIAIASHSLNAAMAATVALYEVTRMAPAP